MLILGAGAGAGLLLGLGGGFWLAGRALRPIQTTMDRQRAFVADASHELRTPLALIRANAELLERAAEQPVQANIASVQDIIGETDRLSALVGQMLTLAQADAGQAKFRREPIDLGVLAADTVRQMRLLAEPRASRST
jgi:signal transduction histidine kinase